MLSLIKSYPPKFQKAVMKLREDMMECCIQFKNCSGLLRRVDSATRVHRMALTLRRSDCPVGIQRSLLSARPWIKPAQKFE